MSSQKPSLSSTLHAFGRKVVDSIHDPFPNNCIGYALEVQTQVNNEIGSASALQDFDVSSGVVLNLSPSSDAESTKRTLHVTNYLLAMLGDRKAFLELDSFFGEVTRITGRTHPIRLAASGSFGADSTIYAQRRGSSYGWEADIAVGLRQPPFRLNPYYDHAIVLGESVGNTALNELAEYSADRTLSLDKTLLPVLVLEVS